MGIRLSELKIFLHQLKERNKRIPLFLKEFLKEVYSQVLMEAYKGNFSFTPLELNVTVVHPLKSIGEIIVPRKRVQREFSTQIPVNSIAIDAGYFGSEGYTEKDGIVSLSSVWFRRRKGVKRFRSSFLLRPGLRSEHLFLMGAFELELARILMFWACEGEYVESGVIDWTTYGIDPTKFLERDFLDLKDSDDLVITLDRPIFPYYLWGYESKSKNVLIEAYKELFFAWEKTRYPVYSVISASTQKSILKVILEMMNGENVSGAQIIIDFIREWIRENNRKALEILDNALGIVDFGGKNVFSSHNDEALTSLLYAVLFEKLTDGTPYLKDFDVLGGPNLGYGDRSTAWKFNSEKAKDGKSLFLKELAGSSSLSFFYVTFGGNDYSRIEFLGDNAWLPYIHYLLMCSMNSVHYPVHLDLAHRVSVMDKKLKKAYLSILQRFTGSFAGSKVRSKAGGVVYA